MCPLKFDLISVTFDPEMADICSVIVTHPVTVQHVLLLPGFLQGDH